MKRRLDCTCIAKLERDEFVGIRSKNGEPQISFPLGYFKDDKELQSTPEDALRACILNLFDVLSDEMLSNANRASQLSDFPSEESDDRFPMRAYIDVLRNYLEFGFYRERETELKRGAHGKIHWGRTIKTTRPMASGHNVIYLNPLARHIDYNENELITQIHKFCVRDAVQRLGFIFGIDASEEPVIDFDAELFLSVLHAKIARTFNDRNLQLFGNLQKIVKYLSGEKVRNPSDQNDFFFGVEKFETVWEAMLDRIFGNLNPGESKEDFYPHCYWEFEKPHEDAERTTEDADKKNTMRPDTIMRQKDSSGADEIFVLDAKFYTRGVAPKEGTLPPSDSITKQIVYAEYIEIEEKKFGVDGSHIYNAFLLPYSAESASENSNPYKMKYFGHAYGDWKNGPDSKNSRPYHKIAGIYLDVKAVMGNYHSSPEAQRTLAEEVRKRPT